MDLTKIKNEFKSINEIFFSNDSNNRFLNIEVSFTNLKQVTQISRKISKFIDSLESDEKNYILKVYSSGIKK